MGFHHGMGPRRQSGSYSLPLRKRINSGEVLGPTIFLAGSIFPKDGRPEYLPPEMQLPMVATPEEARQLAERYMQMGARRHQAVHRFVQGRGQAGGKHGSATAKAAVDVAHAAGKPVFAHPQNTAGVEAVIAAGVDVMAHTVTRQPGYPPEQLARFKQQNIALTPTLSLFAKLPIPPEIVARVVDNVVSQLKAFSDNGGTVLFGTDVGFTQIYDTTLEYELMRRALSERRCWPRSPPTRRAISRPRRRAG